MFIISKFITIGLVFNKIKYIEHSNKFYVSANKNRHPPVIGTVT